MATLTIYADCRITRRKLFHVVTDASGAVRFRSRLIGDCLAYCEDEGQAETPIVCVADREHDRPRAYLALVHQATDQEQNGNVTRP